MYSLRSYHLAYENISPPQDCMVSQGAFLEWTQEAIPELMKTRDLMVVALTGPSGCGKTTLAEGIELNQWNAIQSVRLELDQFFSVLRGDRNDMMASQSNWWDLIYNKDILREVLSDVRDTGVNAGEVQLIKTYKGNHFEFGESLNVPSGKKLFIMPGHDSYSLISQVFGARNVIQVLLMRPIDRALHAALVRDINQGKASCPTSIEERFNFRHLEYSYQYPIYRQMVGEPGVITVDNGHLPIDWQSVTEKQELLIRQLVDEKMSLQTNHH